MDKKTIQKRRLMGYFIDATIKIMEEEGIENVTIRKVADEAGYNSATLYNYFSNLDHLILFASMKYLKKYTEALTSYVSTAKSNKEKFFLIWECFCKYSFSNPKIYNLIFFSDFSNCLTDIIKEYYSIFPDELGSSEELNFMLLGDNIYSRSYSIIKVYLGDHNLSDEEIYKINEMTVLIHEGMLKKFLRKDPIYSVEESVDRTMEYIRYIVDSYLK